MVRFQLTNNNQIKKLNSIIQTIDETLRGTTTLVWFYGISTIVGYLMPNSLYTYILDIYDLVWFGFMVYQPL